MARWAIMGWFWRDRWQDGHPVEPSVPTTFTGEIEVDENGKFKGTTDDIHGKAVVTGKISTWDLVLEKEYLPDKKGESHGAKGKISYNMRTATIPTEAGERITAGWKGSFRIRENNRDLVNRAACMMYPL